MVKEFRTVKRKANVGERILITKEMPKACPYKKGDIFEVTNTFYSNIVSVKGLHNMPVYYADYEVIIENNPKEENEMNTKQLTDYSYEELLDAIKAKAQAEVKPKSPAHEVSAELSARINSHRTFQQQRDEVIEQAKRDVAGLSAHNDKSGDFTGVSFEGGFYVVEEEFIVNKEKRTVVCLLRGVNSGVVRAKGIAKCAPTDCFNSSIGKAISLRRALGLEVPAEYLTVPQPTEVRVGDVVKGRLTGSIAYIDKVDECMAYGKYAEGDDFYAQNSHFRIIDDSHEGE